MPCRTPELQREYQRKWMIARRAAWLAEHGPCANCGSSERLEVDHIDRKLKALHVGALWSMAHDNPRRVAELAKCQVLCHACHLLKTRADRQPPFIHGTYPTYDTHRCRCDLCRAANMERQRRQRSKPSRYPLLLKRRVESGIGEKHHAS